jgi:hypothetical protein
MTTSLKPDGFRRDDFDPRLIAPDGQLPKWARSSLGSVLKHPDATLYFAASDHPALKGFTRELGPFGDPATSAAIEAAFIEARDLKKQWRVARAAAIVERAAERAAQKTSKPAAKAADYPAATNFNDGL